MWKNEQNEFPNAGHRIDRKEVDYSLQGSAASKIFRAFNALGTIAFSFGDAMLPEIQVNIWYYAEIHAVSVHSTPKLHWNSELCARTGEDEHVQRRVDGVLDHRHVLLEPGIKWVLVIWLSSTALHPVLPDFSKMDNCDGKSICSHSDHWLLSGNTPVTSFFFHNFHSDRLSSNCKSSPRYTAGRHSRNLNSGFRRKTQATEQGCGGWCIPLHTWWWSPSSLQQCHSLGTLCQSVELLALPLWTLCYLHWHFWRPGSYLKTQDYAMLWRWSPLLSLSCSPLSELWHASAPSERSHLMSKPTNSSMTCECS